MGALTTVLQKWEYLASYGDLINAFGPDPDKAAVHYEAHFTSENRQITFSAWEYLASYDDLIGAFGPDAVAAAKHYVTYGYDEGRDTNAFDAQAYLDNYHDLSVAFTGATALAKAAEHYVVSGRMEGRNDYTLVANALTVNEGNTVQFTLDTHDLAQGTTFSYTLTGSGITLSDLDNGDLLSGVATVDANGLAVISVDLAADLTTEGPEMLKLSIAGHEKTVTVVDSSITPVPTYTLAPAMVTVDEGSTVNFTLTTTNVPAGSSFAYTLDGTGITAADVVGGSLSGVAVIDAVGKAVISVNLAADMTDESIETLKLSVAGQEALVTVNDTSFPTLELTAGSSSVKEGETVYFTLATTGVAIGSHFDYTITGVQAADVVGGQLTGTAVVGTDGKAIVAVNVAQDGITGETESVILTFNDYPTTLTKSVPVVDQSSYTLAAVAPSIEEGHTAYFVLQASSVAQGAQFQYVLTGVQAADIVGGSLTGTATIGADGKAIIAVDLVSDGINDTETLRVSLLNDLTVFAQTTITNPSGYNLTVDPDRGLDDQGVRAESFISIPETSIAGFSVNTLQDEDILIGLGNDAVLNATIGNTLFDNTEELISPTMTNVKTVNVNLNSGDLYGMGFAGTDGVEEVNINRLSDNQGSAHMVNLQDSTDSVGVFNVNTDGNIYFNWDEGQLEGLDDALTMTLGAAPRNVILGRLGLSQGDFSNYYGDSYEDEGFGFEEIDVVVNGRTNVDEFFINENHEEENDNGSTQSITFDVNAALEINHLEANGAEEITIHAGADVVIADDEDHFGAGPSNDGIHTWDLQTLTIDETGDVMIDGLNGAWTGVHVAGSTMEGDLSLGVRAITSVNAGTLIESGSGDDTIITYGDLGGDVYTNGGDDSLTVLDIEHDMKLAASSSYGDFLPTANVFMGEGKDTVTGDDMLASGDIISNQLNADKAPAIAATIDLGNGDNRASIGEMRSAVSWNDWNTNDNDNNDDTYQLVGATITGGTGADTVDLVMMQEQAVISVDGGNDDVTFNSEDVENGGSNELDLGDQYGMPAVMWGDSSEGRERVNITDESAAPDILGAQVYLGEGDNSITFNDDYLETPEIGDPAPSGFPDNHGKAILLMGEGALVQAGSGNDEFNVDFVNDVTVAAQSNWGTYRGQKMIKGIDTINLTAQKVENSISDLFGAGNDASVELDVLRVDSALDTINLVSEEDITTSPDNVYNEDHIPGNPVSFQLDNLRQVVDVNLTAHEASGVDENWHVKDDGDIFAVDKNYTPSVATGDPSDGVYSVDYYMQDEIDSDEDIVDVYLTVNNDDNDASSHSNTFKLDITAGSGEFDLSLTINKTLTLTGVGDVDSDNLIEDVTLNFADAGSHYINMEGFGDKQHAITNTTDTSLTVTSVAGPTETITVVNTDAAEITFLGNSAIVANVHLVVDAENNYTITTGTGNDIIDMRADNVNTKDTITAGDGRDILVVSGDDSLGQKDGVALAAGKNLDPYLATTEGTLVDDDVFATVTGFEVITIDTDAGEETGNGDDGSPEPQRITLDEDADDFDEIDTINIIGTRDGSQAHWLDLVIGDDYNKDAKLPGNKLTVDARMHYAEETIQIVNSDNDEIEQRVNLDVKVNTEEGTQLNFVDTGNELAEVDVYVLSSREDVATTTINNSVGVAEGNVRINVQDGSFDKLILEEGHPVNANETGEGIVITIADEWTENNGQFLVDATAIVDTDANLATGGAVISVEYGDNADLTIEGTQNNDLIFGGMEDDTISGNNGYDVIHGDDVIGDVLTVEATSLRAGDQLSVTYGGVIKTYTALADVATTVALDDLVNQFNADVTMADSLALRDGNTIVMRQTAAEWLTSNKGFTDFTFTPVPAQPQVTTITLNDLGYSLVPLETVSFAFVSSGNTYSYNGFGNVPASIATQLANNVVGETWTVSGSYNIGNGDTTFTFTGPNDGASFEAPIVTVAGGNGAVVTLVTVAGEPETEQADNTFVNDALFLGDGNDMLSGDSGNDTIYGHGGNDVINGDANADTLYGNDGNDTINGGTGNDWIDGGFGADVLTGGTGSDTFDYNATVESSGLIVDHVTDFVAGSGNDVFDFSALLAEGGFTSGSFVGTCANDTTADTSLVVSATVLQVVYVTDDHMLYADMNGSGDIDGGDLAIHVDVTGSLVAANFEFI